jgi:class 3 adenylate cyclase
MPGPDHQRKLSAIMFTDIVSYTKMMERDEAGTMAFLNFHNVLLHMEIQQHGGQVIKTVGDAFLADFSSAVNAVRCAVSIQKRFQEYNREKAETRQLRIGIHIGDVVISNNDIFGDGVNVASRLQALSEPGGICISEDVYHHIRNIREFRFEFMGAKALKNVSKKVKVYKIVLKSMEKDKSASPQKSRGLATFFLLVSLIAFGWVLYLNPLPGSQNWLSNSLEFLNLPPIDSILPTIKSMLPMVFPAPIPVPKPAAVQAPSAQGTPTPAPMAAPSATRAAEPSATPTVASTPTPIPKPAIQKSKLKKKARVKAKPKMVRVLNTPTPQEESKKPESPLGMPPPAEGIKPTELPVLVPTMAAPDEPLPGMGVEQTPMPISSESTPSLP